MKKTFELLSSLDIDLDLFYAIRFNIGEVFLQGHYNSTLVEKLQKDGYVFRIDEYGYGDGKKYFNQNQPDDCIVVKIILT